MSHGVFQALLYHAELKHINKLDCCTDNWILFVAEMKSRELYFMNTNNISCMSVYIDSRGIFHPRYPRVANTINYVGNGMVYPWVIYTFSAVRCAQESVLLKLLVRVISIYCFKMLNIVLYK